MPDAYAQTEQESDLPVLEEQAVYLYFTDTNNRFLMSEKLPALELGKGETMGRNIIEALINGPKTSGLMRTLPENTKLRAFYIYKDRAYADFSKELSENHPGGVNAEILTIYSIVNSLALNIDKIDKVVILVEGKQKQSLAGHISLLGEFKADLLLVR